MHRYEYKVVPAPSKGTKAKGVKTPEGRFALTIEQLLNQMGADGWEFQRAELLPSDERSGLTGSVQNWRNVLVFRRAVGADATDAAEVIATPVPTPVPGPMSEPAPVEAPAPLSAEVNDPPMASGAERMLKDNGVEELSDVAGMTEALKARAERQADDEPDDAAEPDESVKRD